MRAVGRTQRRLNRENRGRMKVVYRHAGLSCEGYSRHSPGEGPLSLVKAIARRGSKREGVE